ncbi:MAG: hypothetical protein ACP5U1_05295 [Desulfomonilaceae bacterium]
MSLRKLIFVMVGLVILASVPLISEAYMPPPDQCELAPMTYGPPEPPTCAGPPTIPPCTPCPPNRCYPTKLVGPPPAPLTICKCPPEPCPATYRICPPPACPPPPCMPVTCGPQNLAGCAH